jgi:hypothetical protein
MRLCPYVSPSVAWAAMVQTALSTTTIGTKLQYLNKHFQIWTLRPARRDRPGRGQRLG